MDVPQDCPWDNAIWNSNTHGGDPGAGFVRVTDDGQLRLLNGNGDVLWTLPVTGDVLHDGEYQAPTGPTRNIFTVGHHQIFDIVPL